MSSSRAFAAGSRVLAATVLAGALAASFAFVHWAQYGFPSPMLAVVVVLLLALGGEVTAVPVSIGGQRQICGWGETSFLVGVVFLPLSSLVLVTTAAVVIAQGWQRRGLRRISFNAANTAVCALVSGAAVTWMAAQLNTPLTHPGSWWLLAVGVTICNLINRSIVAAYISATTESTWWGLVSSSLGGQLLNLAGNLLLSLSIVAAWTYSRATLVALPLLFVLLWQANNRRLESETERDALGRLAAASAPMPALSLDEMTDEVRRRAAALFGAADVRLRVTAGGVLGTSGTLQGHDDLVDAAILLGADDAREPAVGVHVPLRGRDGELGILSLDVDPSGGLTQQEQDVLTTFANTTGAALETVLAHQAQLHAAQHDTLTGLPNRALLATEAGRILGAAALSGAKAAVIMIDLDGFKNVNDTLGHAAGDRLLVEIGARLAASVRPRDCVARLGGDEFVVLLDGLDSDIDAGRLAATLVERVSVPVTLDGLRIAVEASAGVALFPDHGVSIDALLRCADVAMYDAKRRGDGVLHYDSTQDLASPERLSLLADLQTALDAHDQLSLHFQPQLDLRSGLTGNVEALVRWTHPTRGPLSPAEFVPVIEHSALIGPFTMKVLEAAVRSCVAWQSEASLHGVGVSVNLSARNLMHRDLPDEVARVLARHGLPARKLVLEITETAAMNDTEVCESVLGRLRDLGVRLSVDDFGTGYASLTFLRRIDVAEVKLDRAFVADMLEDEAAATIVGATVALAHGLGLIVVAEGVESPEQLAALSLAGCDLAQGYFLSRPVPAGQLAERADAAVSRAAQVGVIDHVPQVHPPRQPRQGRSNRPGSAVPSPYLLTSTDTDHRI